MTRVLIVPAAGRGSRLGTDLPKLLVPVNGRAMIDHIIGRYRGVVDAFLVVVAPSALEAVEQHLRGTERVELLVQPSPTGMLDAIMVPRARVGEIIPDEVWVTWCDQVAVGENTIGRLAAAMAGGDAPWLAFPTIESADPYIHFTRDGSGRITGVLHRREGERLPARGEGDIGLFAMRREAYLAQLPVFAARAPVGQATGERNFLPFIPWLARLGRVSTIPASAAIEAVGINTPAELARVSEYLAGS